MFVINYENAIKKATNVTIDFDVARKKKEKQWLEENKKAIDKQNERIEKYGGFSDSIRRF